MKKIHVLPTEHTSRLYLSDYGKELNLSGYPLRNYTTGQNIYITNDEEIKEGDFYLHISNDINGIEYTTINTCHKPHRKQDNEWYVDGMYSNQCKKIILTTDQELIADGVQAIDDEFLEWFVKNPSCEEIEIEDWYSIYLSCCQSKEQCSCNKKRIIIPKQVTKQGTMSEAIKQVISNQLKQERLEEAFEFWSDRQSSYDELDILRFGAKWQQERSYSEEEVINLLYIRSMCQEHYESDAEVREWFNKYKNK